MINRVPPWDRPNWRTDFDWTDPNDAPVSWEELDKELEEGNKVKKIKVRFVNRGHGTDDGLKEVNVLGNDLCDMTAMPILVIENPWWSGDKLKCQWFDNEWVCDLD